MKVTFDFDESKFEQAVLREAKAAIIMKIETVRCPEHGKAAVVTATGNSLSELKWSIAGCCDVLITRVKVELSK